MKLSYLPIYIVLISDVKACANNAHSHSVAELERAPSDATDSLISIAPSEGAGIRAVLC